eukprot:3808357-Lingulodinium_polyedra.AAC.1
MPPTPWTEQLPSAFQVWRCSMTEIASLRSGDRSPSPAAEVAKARSSWQTSWVRCMVCSGPQERPARCAATAELSAAIRAPGPAAVAPDSF